MQKNCEIEIRTIEDIATKIEPKQRKKFLYDFAEWLKLSDKAKEFEEQTNSEIMVMDRTRIIWSDDGKKGVTEIVVK